jgi:CRISPR-associated protein Cst1
MTTSNQQYSTSEWFVKVTGDPFADIGGFVIKYLSENGTTKGKSISQLIEWMTNVYVNKWGGKLNAFFLNSTITQPAFQGARKTTETLEYFRKLLNDELPYKNGCCRISGEKTKLFAAGRDNHILSGSGTFINFNSGHEAGLFLSKEMIIRTFFLPFGILQLGDKIGLIYSNNEVVTKYSVKENCSANISNLLNPNTEGVLKSEFGNPSNALFAFVDQCLKNIGKAIDFDEETGITKEDIHLNLMHFTNFGATPDIVLYSIPAIVFDFYARCHSKNNREDWTKFIRSFYRSSKFKDAVYNEENKNWESKKDSIGDSYKTWRNPIYEKLLNNEPIRSYFLKWSVKHQMRFEIIELYQILIRNMDKRAILKIKELADFIVVNRDTDYIKKADKKLNGQKTASELRRYLLTLIQDNLNQGNPNPLIKLEDFVEYLLPEGTNWREVRDLLLIAVYQKIHEQHLKIEVELAETESDSINEND